MCVNKMQSAAENQIPGGARISHIDEMGLAFLVPRRLCRIHLTTVGSSRYGAQIRLSICLGGHYIPSA